MRICVVLLVLAGCAPTLGPEPAAVRGADDVRVATWNVHDLFDEVDRVLPPGELDEVPSPDEVETKLAAVAAVLLRLDADVVLLQEVENGDVLRRLAARAGYPEARLVEGLDPRGIDVAALSRLPVDGYVSHLDEVDAGGRRLWPRDCVEVHVRTAGRPVVVVGTHLSSALSDDGTRRTLQAARLREIADAVRASRPGARVLAGGDLNDVPGSAALAPLAGDGAWRRVADPAVATWGSGPEAERLDDLLASADDVAAVRAAAVVDGGDVRRASDHRPVVVEVAVR
jgi:endonuclease/exonuclease/phosphatase family metal-dependent hydrolase